MNAQPQFIWTNQDVLYAWRAQLTDASHHPSLEQQLSHRQRELLQHLAAHYQQLKALPRRVRRSLQRQWRQSLAGVALLLALGQAPAFAATINVSGACNLVNAITAANTNTATGGCRAGSGADTIVLPANSTQSLASVNNSTYFPTGLPVISSVITIDGNGSTIRRSSSTPEFRILAVGANGNLTLQKTTVSGGLTSRGGGGYNAGTLTLTDSTISNNSAEDGGGVANGGTLRLANSTILGNSAAGNGGGVFSSGTVILTNSTISGNSARSDGGGVHNQLGGTVDLTNSTISGNAALIGDGGGIYHESGSVTLTNSTVTRNSASGIGGGVRNIGTLTLARSLISGNTAFKGGPEIHNLGSRGAFIINADNFNLFGLNGDDGVVGNFTPGATDIVPNVTLVAILKFTLANNGGTTKNHALVTGSPAIDAVTDGTCPPPGTDQRGITRPQDGNADTGAACDIGAFELAGSAPATCNGRAATIVRTAASETITGTARADIISGLGGADIISGLGGGDTICGDGGNDTINGGAGVDTCNGGAGKGDKASACETVTGVP